MGNRQHLWYCSNNVVLIASLPVMHKNDRRESDDPRRITHTQPMRTPGNRFYHPLAVLSAAYSTTLYCGLLCFVTDFLFRGLVANHGRSTRPSAGMDAPVTGHILFFSVRASRNWRFNSCLLYGAIIITPEAIDDARFYCG